MYIMGMDKKEDDRLEKFSKEAFKLIGWSVWVVFLLLLINAFIAPIP